MPDRVTKLIVRPPATPGGRLAGAQWISQPPTRLAKQACEAYNASGERCRAGVGPGARYCYLHDPDRAVEAAAARRWCLARMRPAGQPPAAPAGPIDLVGAEHSAGRLSRRSTACDVVMSRWLSPGW